MNKRFKRIFGMTMAGMLITSAVGCSSVKTQDKEIMPASSAGIELSADEPGWQRNSDDKVDLQWYINFSWFTTPWG